MSWFSDWMNPQKPYQEAQKEREKYYNQGQSYQQPYNAQGQDQYQQLMDYIKNLSNPEELQNKWASGYETSPMAQQAQKMAASQGADAASSLGLMGSSPALQAIQAGTSNIGLQDRQQYLDDLMQKYMQGAGLSQGIYNTGAGAAGQMNQNAQGMGQDSAGLKYGEKAAKGGLFNNLLNTGIAGLGAVAGGPIGMGASNALANKLGWNTKGYTPNGSAMGVR